MSAVTADVSLTTISARIETVGTTLVSLLEQDRAPRRIYLWLSQEPHLIDAGVRALPAELEALVRDAAGRIEVRRCANWGPYRKLLPYLMESWGRGRLVATADDDTVYPRHWLSTLVDCYLRLGSVITYRGHQIALKNGALAPYRAWMKGGIRVNPSRLILPTGKDGVLYDTAFFHPCVLDIRQALRLAPTTDDLWFKWATAMNGVNTYAIETNYRAGTFAHSTTEGGLYETFNAGGGNDRAAQDLNAFFRERHGFDMARELAAEQPA